MAIMHEFHNNTAAKVALAPVVVTDNTAQTTTILDMQGIEYAELIIVTGAIADADVTFAVTGTHGDTVDSVTAPTTITDATAVDPACLIGTLTGASFGFADDNAVRRVGYNPNKGGGKRFVRFTITPAGNAGAAPLAAVWLLRPMYLPAA